jgi:threonine dehydratase
VIALDDIRRAQQRLDGVTIRTPLLPLKFGPAGTFVKCENLQLAGSFKIRGAYNNIAQLTDEQKKRGVVAYSSGNHAQGVALAARMLGVRATIVMLKSSIAEKVDQTRAYGAEVILGGDLSEEIKAAAERLAEERGATVVQPFNQPGTIAGQGTVGLEILQDLPGVETVVVQIGGGGLISGVATAIRSLRKQARVIGVEPAGAPKMTRALEAGGPVTLPGTDTIADGLKPVRCGDLTYEHVKEYVERVKLMVEPSGAAAFAAVVAGKVEPRGPTVCVISGGNADPGLVKSLL